MATRRTGFVWDERCMWHDTGRAFGPSWPYGWHQPADVLESPESKRRLRNLLDASGMLERLVPLRPRPATEAELLRFHVPEYVARIRAESAAAGGDGGDGMSPFGRGSYDIALLAAGGAIVAVDAVLDGDVDNAYALVRPPGHHAERDAGKGFCLFGNTALAAMHAREARGVERVAIVDWDVHHGNGTQQAFWEDPTVLAISIHQDRKFPAGSGSLDESGVGAGAGTTLNVPLPAGCGDGAYAAVFERVVVPALGRFAPDLILVACGLDANAFDPLARMSCTSNAYRAMTRAVMDVADVCCDGRLAVIHEGGYSVEYVPYCGLAVIETLHGARSDATDPFEEFLSALPDHALAAWQDDAIRAAEPLVERVPVAASAVRPRTLPRRG